MRSVAWVKKFFEIFFFGGGECNQESHPDPEASGRDLQCGYTPYSGTRRTLFRVKTRRIYPLLKIRRHRKFKLFNENLLETGNIVLLIKQQHRLFVINGIDCPE